MASRWSDIFERELEREPELGPSNEPGPQPDLWFADKVEDVPPMQATQAPQPEAEFQDEPAPKRKKKTSVAAREWERNFALLEAFRQREGHADLPPGYKVGGTRLRDWLDRQRQRWQAREWSAKTRYYEKRSAMSDEELARLEALGVRGRERTRERRCAIRLAPSSRVRVPVKP